MFYINAITITCLGVITAMFSPVTFIIGIACLAIIGWVNYRLFQFRALNYFALKKYVKTWVRQYSNVTFNKISLYQYSPKLQKYYSRHPRIPTKYAIVFELANCDKDFKKLEGGYSKASEKPSDRTPGLEFLSDIQYLHTIPQDYRAFIDASFRDIYSISPPDNYVNDWTLIPRNNKENLPVNISVDRPRWVLYRKSLDFGKTIGSFMAKFA